MIRYLLDSVRRFNMQRQLGNSSYHEHPTWKWRRHIPDVWMQGVQEGAPTMAMEQTKGLSALHGQLSNDFLHQPVRWLCLLINKKARKQHARNWTLQGRRKRSAKALRYQRMCESRHLFIPVLSFGKYFVYLCNFLHAGNLRSLLVCQGLLWKW